MGKLRPREATSGWQDYMSHHLNTAILRPNWGFLPYITFAPILRKVIRRELPRYRMGQLISRCKATELFR